MKLRTSVRITSFITVGVFLAYGAALFYVNRTMAHLAQEVRNANELSTRISLLRTLSLDNLIYQTERSKRQWETVYDQVRHMLVDKVYLDLQLEYGLGEVGDKVKIVGDTFQKLLNMPAGARPDDQEAEVGRQLRTRLTTQLMLTTQDLLNRFANLSEEVNRRLIRSQQLSSVLDILAVLSLGSLIIGAGIFLQRSVLQPILKLHDGAEIIGAGNLDYKVGLDTPDELGELSMTFDRMISNLQKVTVSRDELAREMAERRLVEAELAETLRQKEEALALAEHLASFPQLNPNPVLEFGMHGGITYSNPAAGKFLEQWAPDINLRDFLPADWEEIQQASRERGEHTFQREIRIKDRVFQEAIYYSESFKVWRIYPSDISQRILAEAALRESEARFRSLFENMTEGVVVHELIYGDNGPAVDYRIVSANPAFEKHTGLLAAAIQGQLGSRAYGLDEAPYLEVYARVAQTGEPTTFETFFPPLQRYFHISVTSPKKDYFVTVFEDITERRQMEERLRAQAIELSQAVSDLEETNAELERFMYMISHDLKSPLVTISTFLGFLEEDLERSDTGRIDKDIHYIRTAADKMGQLLNELLEMSRIGRLVNPPVEVSFQEVAQEALQALAGPIAVRGVQVQTGSEDVILFGDRPRLVEIWQNLVENAVKYLGQQSVPLLTIGLERQGEATVFFVCDNGMGIDPRYHDKIFGIFEKLDPKSGGTGIGLAIAKRIVELYQGNIWVESAGLSQGACFRFTLPGAVRGL